MSGPEWFFFLYLKYWYFYSLKRFWDCDFFLSMSLNLIIWKNEKWYNKRVLIWRYIFYEILWKSFFVFFFVFYKIDEIKWQSNTGQSVLKSKGFYQTGGHFTGLVRWYFVFTDIVLKKNWKIYWSWAGGPVLIVRTGNVTGNI